MRVDEIEWRNQGNSVRDNSSMLSRWRRMGAYLQAEGGSIAKVVDAKGSRMVPQNHPRCPDSGFG
jgi:hypothetical protein